MARRARQYGPAEESVANPEVALAPACTGLFRGLLPAPVAGTLRVREQRHTECAGYFY